MSNELILEMECREGEGMGVQGGGLARTGMIMEDSFLGNLGALWVVIPNIGSRTGRSAEVTKEAELRLRRLGLACACILSVYAQQ